MAKVTPAVNETVGEGKWTVNLTHPSRVLMVENNSHEIQLKNALEKIGYKAERI